MGARDAPVTRVLLAPANPAGVAGALRDGLRERGHQADVVTFEAHPFGYAHDRLAGDRSARVSEGLRAPLRYDVLHWQFALTFVEYADAAWGRIVGRPLQLMHYWGTDVRTREVTERLFPARGRVWGVQIGGDDTAVRRRLALACRLCRAALVSDLELAAQVRPWFKRVYVLPTPLGKLPDPGELPPLPGEGPVVLHAPSHAVTKGTAQISAAIERVAARRPLRPRLVGGMTREHLVAELARADIVVDQLNSETPGVFALEAMSLGRPVMLEFRPKLLAPFARGAPLVRVTAQSLERELDALCADPARRRALGDAGRRYAAEVHRSGTVAAALEHLYAHARTAPPGIYQAGPAGVTPLGWDTV
jgi:hypothetical protein